MDICRLEIISENRKQSMHGRHTQMLILLTEHVVFSHGGRKPLKPFVVFVCESE